MEKKIIFTKKDKPFLIAGPCSAETREQVLDTSKRLFRTGKVDMLRAGIWKPRTSPGSFEGVGSKGLPWMQEAKEITGLPVTVEVAKAKHVEICLEFGVDVLWIGARTTVNPFAVQEIADALKGVNIPVMVKNPINPDLALWIGSVERIRQAGIENIAVIHRGFSNLGEKYYRNRPQWQIAIEYKRRNPDVPIICDPSHICGRRDILQEVSQKALDLDYDGLMIESHIMPDEALSDAKQQITPEVLNQLMEDIVIRDDYQDNTPIQTQLEFLREEINHIDDELLNLLSNRMKVARDIGDYKKKNNITILQAKRWNDIIEKGKLKATKHGLGEEFVVRYLQAIHDESINQQEQVMKKS